MFPRALVVKVLVILAFCAGFIAIKDRFKKPEQVALTGKTMGTYYSIKYIEETGLPSSEQVQQQIDSRLVQINNEMSTYQPDSELSRFNRSTSTDDFELSTNTAKVMAEALRLNKLSQGALDVTVGPLVNLWGFGPQMRVEKVPTKEEITAVSNRIGIDLLQLNQNSLSKINPEVYVDLSAIAKGFAVDYVAEYLTSIGVENYLVEIGGELQLKGLNAQGAPWRIAIEKPQAGGKPAVQEVIAPKNMAIATSGDYRNYFEQEGVRYSHVIDPKTAMPINHRLVSVTVVAKSCMTADGLATAFMVLGAKQGLALANQENIAAFFIVKTDEGFKEVASNAFKPYLQNS